MIVDVTISLRSFVFAQSCAKASIGFTNVSSLAVSLTLVSGRRKVVIGLCATRILQGCSIRAMVSEVSLMYGTVAVVTGPELTLV